MNVRVDGVSYDVHRVKDREGHFVLVGGKVIGHVNRLVTWSGTIDTDEGLVMLGREHQYMVAAIQDVVESWHRYRMDRARQHLRVVKA